MNAKLNVVPEVVETQSPMPDALSVASDPIQQRLQNRRHKLHAPTQSSHSPLRFYCQRFPLFGIDPSGANVLQSEPGNQDGIRPAE